MSEAYPPPGYNLPENKAVRRLAHLLWRVHRETEPIQWAIEVPKVVDALRWHKWASDIKSRAYNKKDGPFLDLRKHLNYLPTNHPLRTAYYVLKVYPEKLDYLELPSDALRMLTAAEDSNAALLYPAVYIMEILKWRKT